MAAAPASTAAAVPRLAHVVVVVFENRERDQVLGSSEAPTFSADAHRYVDLTNYTAVAHPSLPNYLALVSGSTQGITSDCTNCPAHGRSIGSELERAHRSWAAYAEGYPSSPGFAKKHEPFLYFAGQSRHVHPLGALDPHRLPAFALITPDLCDDGHDCPITTADRFLARIAPPLLTVPRTVVFVVFDEGTTDAGGGGHVPALALGTAVRLHTTDAQPANHYTLLRTIEDALRLPRLGASAHTPPLAGIWR
jgi:hypothetical protein